MSRPFAVLFCCITAYVSSYIHAFCFIFFDFPMVFSATSNKTVLDSFPNPSRIFCSSYMSLNASNRLLILTAHSRALSHFRCFSIAFSHLELYAVRRSFSSYSTVICILHLLLSYSINLFHILADY